MTNKLNLPLIVSDFSSESTAAHSSELCVFVSGTFHDLGREREYLSKHVFPGIRQVCRERGLQFTDIDLRWGITEPQAREGKIVEICLNEIHRRLPYIIVLIGDRYGWQPTPQDLAGQESLFERYPWLRQAIDERRSLVEIETLESVRYNPRLDGRISFYVRENTGNATSEGGAELSAFKKRIENRGFLVRQPFSDLETLGAMVEEDLLNAIEDLSPTDPIQSFLERERKGHEAFATTRRRAYVENRRMVDKLTEFVNSPPKSSSPLALVVSGESGSGKSALLAWWSEQYKRDDPDVFLVTHYVGATASSTDHYTLLRRIMLEIAERYDVKEGPPIDPSDIVKEFPSWLARVQKEKMVLVVDAINQLDIQGEAHGELDQQLDWLPEYFPPNVRIIISVLEGPMLNTLRKRNWEELHIVPLSEGERREVVRAYLGEYGKQFDTQQLQRMTSHKKSANPLYLRTSLEELRMFGSYETLNEKIEYYLEAESLDDLFHRVLDRIENDYGSVLTSTVLKLVWASRRGLSQGELWEITGRKQKRLTQLLQALDYHLMAHDGLLRFFHEHLRKAVEKRYVGTVRRRKNAHVRLAEYFASQPIGERRIEEEPWQWEKGKAWDQLQVSITNMYLFEELNKEQRRQELLKYWQALPNHEDMVEVYQNSLADFERREQPDSEALSAMLEKIGLFFQASAKYEESETLYRRALAIKEEHFGKDHASTAYTHTQLGTLLEKKGEYGEAELSLRKALEIVEATHGKDHPSVAGVLDSLATLLYSTSAFNEAQPLFSRALGIRKLEYGLEHPDSIMSLTNMGAVLLAKGELERADVYVRQALSLSEQVMGTEHFMTAMALNNLATVLRGQKNYEEAIPLLERAIEINKTIFGPRHPEVAANLMNLAFFEKTIGMYDDAEIHYKEALSINLEVFGQEHIVIARNLTNIGALLQQVSNKYDEAEVALRKAYAIRKKIFGVEHIGTQVCLLGLATTLTKKGDYDEAEKIYRKSLPKTEKILGIEDVNIVKAYEHFAELLDNTGRDEEAESVREYIERPAHLK